MIDSFWFRCTCSRDIQKSWFLALRFQGALWRNDLNSILRRTIFIWKSRKICSSISIELSSFPQRAPLSQRARNYNIWVGSKVLVYELRLIHRVKQKYRLAYIESKDYLCVQMLNQILHLDTGLGDLGLMPTREMPQILGAGYDLNRPSGHPRLGSK